MLLSLPEASDKAQVPRGGLWQNHLIVEVTPKSRTYVDLFCFLLTSEYLQIFMNIVAFTYRFWVVSGQHSSYNALERDAKALLVVENVISLRS